MNNADGTIETTDLGLAVFLYSLGAELTGIDRTSPRQAVFTFGLTPEQEDEIPRWQSGNAFGNLLGFWNSYRLLKIQLHKTGDTARDGAERCRPTA